MIPSEYYEGLAAVRLTFGSRTKRARANATYYYDDPPRIDIYPFPSDLAYKLRHGTSLGQAKASFRDEITFGMRLVQRGARIICAWGPGELEKFILYHVLLHEIGHHVYHTTRWRQGFVHKPRTVESEQYAEAFARRLRRELFPEVRIEGE